MSFTQRHSERKGLISDDLTPQAAQFWNTNGVSATWTATNWGANAAGPFTSGWVANNDANFTANSLVSFVSNTQVGNITVTNGSNVRLTASGTFSTNGNVRTWDVGSGAILDFAGQLISTAAGTGIIKNGPGIYFSSNGNSYPGGFTLNDGTVIIGGVNALGNGGSLTINGGMLSANASRNITPRYSAFSWGGNFTIGGVTTNVASGNAVSAANITFGDNVSLGAATRSVTIGADGVYTFGGIISGASGSGLTILNGPGAGGAILLSGVNTYTGNTTVSSGSLSLAGNGSIANSPVIEIGGTGIFDVQALTTSLTLAAGQALRGSGTTSTGTIATSSTKGLTTASDSPIQFTAFSGTTPPLTVSGAGTLALQPGNPVTITISNGGMPLASGDHKLIAKATTGSITGLPTSLTVNGDGVNGTPTLVLIAGELYLRVTPMVTLVVNSFLDLSDANAGDGVCEATVGGGNCTLRAATEESNALPGAETITFDPGIFSLEGGNPTITATSELSIAFDVTIDGPGANNLTVAGGGPGGGRIFSIASGASVTIKDLTLNNGGGNGATASGNGGAIYAAGNLTLDAVHVTNSNATTCGGGVQFDGGTHVIQFSTISGNGTVGVGGGVCNSNAGALHIHNSTISGNMATSSGGGMSNSLGATLRLSNSTVTLNNSDASGGGISQSGTALTLESSIIAGNSDTLGNPEISNAGGTVSNGFNIVGDSANDAGSTGVFIVYDMNNDILNTPPQLGGLVDNGGPTPTHRPNENGPGHDKGRNFGVPPFATDQRGNTRTVDWAAVANAPPPGDGTDIGAVELLVPTAAAATISGRVKTSAGRGIAKVYVFVEDVNGTVLTTALTNSFGYFTMYGLPVGETYIVSVKTRRYTFGNPSQVVSLKDNIVGMEFTAVP